MLRESARPFTLICLSGLTVMVIACASLDGRGNAAVGGAVNESVRPVVPVGAALGQSRTVSAPAPRERVILKERAPVRESPHRSFGRELEEQYEEEEDGRRHRRHQDRDDD